jgi:exodeoxyribonuclease-5
MNNLTKEQSDILDELVKSNKSVQTVGGYAGTGKTEIIEHLVQHPKCNNFAVAAFTGKAANVLRNRGIDATTIHSLIYFARPSTDGGVDYIKKPYLDCGGIIIDEASMVGNQLLQDLYSFGLPIIFLGDHGQLEPVGDTGSVMQHPNFTLETVHRNAGEIAFFAEHLRHGFPATAWKSQGKVIVRNHEVADQFYRKNWKNIDQLICAKNNSRVYLNKYIRTIMGRKEENRPEPGDRIICLRNFHKLKLVNGMQGTVDSVMDHRLRFESAGLYYNVPFDPSRFNNPERITNENFNWKSPIVPLDFAYAITCHKAQGDEWQNIMVFEEVLYGCDPVRWNYTAASRAKNSLFWVAN